MLHMEVCPYSYFLWCGYFQGPLVSFVMTDEFSPDILALCETYLDDSIDFSVRGYLPLIQKDFTIHMHDLADYVKEGNL